MTMGDRIKTRQQLLDEQESARPHQVHDNTMEHVNQEGAGIQSSEDAARQELVQLRERMAVIKQETAAEVDRKWVSGWRTPDTFDLKVKTRLTSHREYRSLQNRVRDMKASLPAEPDAATETSTAR